MLLCSRYRETMLRIWRIFKKKNLLEQVEDTLEHLPLPWHHPKRTHDKAIYLSLLFLSNLIFFGFFVSYFDHFVRTAPIFEPPPLIITQTRSLLEIKLDQANQIDQDIKTALAIGIPAEQLLKEDSGTSQPSIQSCSGDSLVKVVLCVWQVRPLPILNQTAPDLFYSLRQILKATDCRISETPGWCYAGSYAILIPIVLIWTYFFWYVGTRSQRKVWTAVSRTVMVIIISLGITGVTSLLAGFVLLIRVHQMADREVTQAFHQLMTSGQTDYPDNSLEVIQALEQSGIVPRILVPTDDAEILAAYLFQESHLTYVQSMIVPMKLVPYRMSLRLPVGFLLLPNHTLIANQITAPELQLILPVLAKRIVTTAYGSYQPDIPEIPFQVLGSAEYHAFAVQKREEQKQAVAELIQTLRGAIQEVNTALSHNQGQLAMVDQELGSIGTDYQEYVVELEQTYQVYCTSSEFSGSAECRELQATIERNRQIIDQNKKDLEQAKQDVEAANVEALDFKQEYQAKLTEFLELLKLLEDQPVTTEFQAGIFLFDGPRILIQYHDGQHIESLTLSNEASASDKIRQEVMTSFVNHYRKPSSFAEYLSTSIHEYLHASAYQGEETIWPTFMEEGVTEYLTIQALAPYLTSSEATGMLAYADQVRLMNQMTARVDKNTLLRLYFRHKTKSDLKAFLEDSLSNFDFQTFEVKGETLHFMGYKELEKREQLKQELEEMVMSR